MLAALSPSSFRKPNRPNMRAVPTALRASMGVPMGMPIGGAIGGAAAGIGTRL